MQQAQQWPHRGVQQARPQQAQQQQQQAQAAGKAPVSADAQYQEFLSTMKEMGAL